MPRWLNHVATAIVCLSLAGTVWGATLSEQRRDLSRATTALRVAERMAEAKRHDDAAAAFAEAQEALARAADGLNERLERTFERATEQLAETHAVLTAAGVKVPAPTKLAATRSSPPPTLGGGPGGDGSRVSFVDHVVPLLTDKCGGCHVRDNKGDVSFASYNNIVEGAPAGRYVEVGSGMESLLIDVIVSGQMPPNGNEVSPAEARVLLTWINEGAKFDGDDPAKPLRQLTKAGFTAPPAGEPALPKPDAPPMTQPTGNETVSFALDIAPLLVESCSDCHGTAGPRAGLSVANFERLWAGGSAGPAIQPGDAQASLLVQKLRGTAKDGARMPQNRPAWNDQQIALVEKWIAEGATFDGPSTTEPLARVATLVKASRSSPAELSAEREARATEVWRLAIPDEPASRAASQQFLAIGNLPESGLEKLTASAELQTAAVLDFFKRREDPLNKARITLYAFDSRIDYSEFGTMVERRGLPSDARGHARLDLVHPYVALIVDDQAAESLDRQLATYLATLWVAGQSDDRLPAWFTAGAGMAVAARLHAKDREVRRWRDELPTAIASLTEPDSFMTGKLPPRSSELLAFGFVDALLQKPANFHRLVQAAAKTSDFDTACQQVFQRSAKELAQLWASSQRRRR